MSEYHPLRELGFCLSYKQDPAPRTTVRHYCIIESTEMPTITYAFDEKGRKWAFAGRADKAAMNNHGYTDMTIYKNDIMKELGQM